MDGCLSASNVENALRANGRVRLVFVVTLQDDRPRLSDVVNLQMMLQNKGLPPTHLTNIREREREAGKRLRTMLCRQKHSVEYGVVINNVDREALARLKQEEVLWMLVVPNFPPPRLYCRPSADANTPPTTMVVGCMMMSAAHLADELRRFVASVPDVYIQSVRLSSSLCRKTAAHDRVSKLCPSHRCIVEVDIQERWKDATAPEATYLHFLSTSGRVNIFWQPEIQPKKHEHGMLASTMP